MDIRIISNLAKEIGPILVHPAVVRPDDEADRFIFLHVICINSIMTRIENKILIYFPGNIVNFLRKLKKLLPLSQEKRAIIPMGGMIKRLLEDFKLEDCFYQIVYNAIVQLSSV